MSSSAFRQIKVRDGRVVGIIGGSRRSKRRATFFPEDAHLSVPLHHQQEILGALATAMAAEAHT